MLNNAKPVRPKKQPANRFENLLDAWQAGKDVAWAELMAAWIEAPTAPRTRDTVKKLIRRLDAK